MKFPKKFNLLSASHVRSPKQEKEAAERLGGTVTPGSGNQYQKGDVRVRKIMRLECKTTIRKSFPVTREMIRKIDDAATGAGEVPAIEVELAPYPGSPYNGRVAIVPLWVLNSIVEHQKS